MKTSWIRTVDQLPEKYKEVLITVANPHNPRLLADVKIALFDGNFFYTEDRKTGEPYLQYLPLLDIKDSTNINKYWGNCGMYANAWQPIIYYIE